VTDGHTQRLESALADRYKIQRKLGEGGMASVYLAGDLKHERQVAVKVLKPELAAVLGGERFLQEIKTTAGLQHPHILPLYDSGEADGFLFYVMPYIEGETLRERLDREKQLGVEEAVRIAVEVADALDYAHRRGVVHRDIKPANILLGDGRALVADFGIALAVSAAGGGRMTETGLSLGTPHYMSPEQATAEKDVTGRSDVYSLAGVLYEMLTGQPPHTAGSVQAIIMKIVTERPEAVTKVRHSVPRNVDAALAKALEKLPADRFQSPADFAAALKDPHFALTEAGAVGASGAGGRWNGLTTVFAAVAAVMGLAAAWLGFGGRASAPDPVIRYVMDLPVGQGLDGLGIRIALSPDGSLLAYVGEAPGGQQQLWLRRRDQLEAIPLPGTEGAEAPFFSADGTRIGYFSPRGTIRVAPADGGLPRTVTDNMVGSAGATWSSDGFIYADALGEGGLVRVNPQSGATEPFTALGPDDKDHTWPQALPDGSGVLFVVWDRNGVDVHLALADAGTGSYEVLTEGIYGTYAASGHLLFVSNVDVTLWAQSFDLKGRTLSGEPVRVVPGVKNLTVGMPGFTPELTVSASGTLMYVTSRRPALRDSTELVWVTRDGEAQVIDPDWKDRLTSQGLDLSPDGRRLAVVHDGDIWVKELDDGPVSKMSFDGGLRPTWTPDGDSLVFISGNRAGYNEPFIRSADAGGSVEPLLDEGPQVMELEFTGDGSWAVFRFGGGGISDILARHLEGDGELVEVAVSPEQEMHPAVSPDGRWVAYTTFESGRPEVWVRSFPNTQDGEWQVSRGGGTEPLWAHSGSELFYRSENDELMSVPITPSATTFVAGEPTPLFSVKDYVGFVYRRMYDVSPDDQRFVMLRRIVGYDNELFVVVENFFEELKARMGEGNR
jgi:serine/threonine-protein kinase